MKKGTLINSQLSEIIASLGHGDEIVIADAGLPIPEGPVRVDLALTRGVPAFQQVLETVLTEMFIEEAVIAEQMEEHSPQIVKLVKDAIGDVPLRSMQHAQLKVRARRARAVIRTGEFTQYANVILVAGPWGFDN
jgi:D-ribose pyranase